MDDLEAGAQPHCPDCGVVLRPSGKGDRCPECGHFEAYPPVERPTQFDGPSFPGW